MYGGVEGARGERPVHGATVRAYSQRRCPWTSPINVLRPATQPRRRPRARRRRVSARVAWARAHMPVLGRLRAEFERDRPLAGRRIGMCLHVEAKTAVLVETLLAGGAEVAWTGSPATTDDGVAAAMATRRGLPRLRAQGGRHAGPPRAHRARAARRPGPAPRQRRRPDRGHHRRPGSRVIAATEETTSGRHPPRSASWPGACRSRSS